MDKIRRNQRRPTVGLVLSGGGAKGAAEVGVLKYLEEMNIPIDLICGTSIGGLIGAIYSIGYTSDDVKELFTSQDWDMILSDKVSYEHM
ncbi:MAG: patatin-like phospholipase family protein, partial [Bacteroidales bacterium]|nr:patatin-like phospholipase family protein [Bacteroidales bacterium]